MTGTLTLGELIIFTRYLKIAYKPMGQMAKDTGQIAKAITQCGSEAEIASRERIIDLLEVNPEIKDLKGSYSAPLFSGKVEFHNVSFGYETSKQILHNISFTVEPGQKIALVVSSGGGKYSIASLLLRLYHPQEGNVLIDDQDIRQYTIKSLRQQISIVLQDSILFATSIRDNIGYGYLDATDAEIERAARLANAHEFIMNLPEGYDTIVGERGATLSGGQRQRIAIARAAIRRARIVILDEPTVGLDNHSERIVTEALERLTQNTTTFLITHDLRTVHNADQILYINNGKIIDRGTHEELMSAGQHYATLYKS